MTDSAPPPPRRRRRVDRQAARALQDRRPEALALVMHAHGGTLLGYLTQLLRDRATAEDVLQQVLLEVWQRAPSYDPERAGVLTWVLTIAKSRALDELRRRVPEPVDPLTAVERSAMTRSPEHVVNGLAQLRDLLEAEQRSERQR